MNKGKALKNDIREIRVLPLAEEQVKIGKRVRETGITRIHTRIREDTRQINQQLKEDEVEIEHVRLDRYVDEPAPIRREGDVTIVPLYEEVLVVEKKLLLKEELHIRKRSKTKQKSFTVVLRREEAIVEHRGVDQSAEKNSDAGDR